MTIRSSAVPRITGLVTALVAASVLLFITIGPILRGKPLLAGVPLLVLIVLAAASVVRRWPLTTLTVDTETITVKRAGRTTAVPRRKVRGLLQPKPDAAPVEFVDEHGQTLIKIADPFRQEDLKKVASYLGLEIQ